MEKTYYCVLIALIALTLTLLFNKWGLLYEGLNLVPASDPILDLLVARTSVLFNQPNKKYTGALAMLNTKNIMKDITIVPGDKSYTINKKKIYMCLKDANNEYYNLNMLTYVLLHEIAHTLSVSVNHTEEFKQIFGELLYEAIQQGVYNPNIPIVMDYCNTPQHVNE